MALLLAGWDEAGPRLFHTDPSGTFVEARTPNGPPTDRPELTRSSTAERPLHDLFYGFPLVMDEPIPL